MGDIINVTVTSPVTETIEVSAGTITPQITEVGPDPTTQELIDSSIAPLISDISVLDSDLTTAESDISALEAFIASITPTSWTTVTYQNSWVSYGGGFSPGQYRKIGDIVYLRGLIANGTVGSEMFTLPVGFRPLTPMIFDIGVKSSVYGSVRLSITTAGAVSISSSEYTGATGNAWVTLDGILFSTI